MTDEKYVFVSDVREKKSIGRSARNKRAHAGKGGRVKLPSDYLSNKELKAMNGECKAYRLNEPMSWKEFKAMPDDIKIVYIKAIREKFNAPLTHIGAMLGCSQQTLSREAARLGLSPGKGGKGCPAKWDRSGFAAWCNGEKPDVVPEEEAPGAGTASLEDIVDPVPAPLPEIKTLPLCPVQAETAVPKSGSLTFAGSAESALNTVSVLLGGADVHITITWRTRQDEGACGEQ